ncbi:integral membrane protein 2C-like [Corythoichthys intestinalis]|uniref:integral membrane protein 2C-like n=1 Tax=Corythoichthys intestinalis TaxID=161448 RepID=UPI0025A5975E|nr:integral membrane protein 2C-like [Corythoichthys intestinalis]XP_061795466.1 integral membrane protein 2C-like [Nerophis lumbriciformis]
MVRLTFYPVSAEKDGKEDDGCVDIPDLAEQEEQKIDGFKSNAFALRHFCAVVVVLIVMVGVALGSILAYRFYFLSRILDGGTLFHCNVIYSDGLTRDRVEFSEAVRILLEHHSQFISVPVPNFGKGDPADIVHDFRMNLTAYWDKDLDNCYISQLDTAHVPPPENLLDLFNKVDTGMYFPHNYMVKEEMVVTSRAKKVQSPIINEMCHNKDTYWLAKRANSASRTKRSKKDCHIIRHFENPYLIETSICNED